MVKPNQTSLAGAKLPWAEPGTEGQYLFADGIHPSGGAALDGEPAMAAVGAESAGRQHAGRHSLEQHVCLRHSHVCLPSSSIPQ